MAIKGFNVIAEKINDSVPSTNKLFVEGNIDAVVALAKEQADDGAAYIDVNVGSRDAALMERLVKEIQNTVHIPLAIDSPSFQLAEAGLKAYDPAKAGGKKPILNSISMQRLEMFELAKIQPMKVLLMSSERNIDGKFVQNRTGQDVLESAREIHAIAKSKGFVNDDIIFDPTIAPIGTDYEGLTRMTVTGIQMIGSHPDLKGCHQSVGLSNFTVQLPAKTKSGELVKTPLECAFLTIAFPLGLDFSVANAKKNYELLPETHPALITVRDVLKLDGYDVLMRVREFYS